MNKVAEFAVQSVFDLAWLGKWCAVFAGGILAYSAFASVITWNPAPHTFYGSDTGICDSGCD